jgi:hypothetical protein
VLVWLIAVCLAVQVALTATSCALTATHYTLQFVFDSCATTCQLVLTKTFWQKKFVSLQTHLARAAAIVELGDDNYNLTIMDITGRIVRQMNGVTGNVVIERGNMTAGIYMMTVVNDKGERPYLKVYSRVNQDIMACGASALRIAMIDLRVKNPTLEFSERGFRFQENSIFTAHLNIYNMKLSIYIPNLCQQYGRD